MTRRFDLVVFDWDGTLFDSTRLIARCIQAACADVGTAVPSDRDASYVIGLGLADALRLAAPELAPDRYGELGERYRHHYLASLDDIVLFDGTLEMLGALKERNHALAVATGKNRRGLDDALRRAVLPAPPTRPRASPIR
jgi:phosphoglycolate phosphatase